MLDGSNTLDRSIQDPAVAAAAHAQAAERAFLAVPANTLIDELGMTFVTAQTRWQRADEAFADTVPTSHEGALLKLRALEELQEGMSVGDDCLELRHIRALMAFVKEQMARHAA